MRAPPAGRRFCAASSPLRLARIDARRRDLVEEIHSDWGRGDFSRADVFWDDVEFVFSDDFPDPGTWRGLDGLAAAMRQWLVFRGDRMSRIEIYPTREAALRAAGLAADNA